MTKTPNTLQKQALDLLYPLADALQMTLTLQCKGDYPEFARGEQDITIPVTSGFSIPATAHVHVSGINFSKERAWLLMHVMGNLWVYTIYYHTSGEVYFALLDATKIKPYGVASLSESNAATYFSGSKAEKRHKDFAKGVVAEFTRFKDDTKWVKHGKADRLDQGHPVPPEEFGGNDHSPAPGSSP
jgi:hypothetical protein